MIGRCANQARESASMLYKNTNIMFSQNKCLQKCSTHVKNIAINAYGSIYSLENMTEVPSYVRAAHRYMTRRVHSDWRQFADLPGPNITSRKLYTTYSLDSVEVVHRRSRNKFLLKAELSSNSLIRDFIGNLPKITVWKLVFFLWFRLFPAFFYLRWTVPFIFFIWTFVHNLVPLFFWN